MDMKNLKYCKRCDRIVPPEEKVHCSKCGGKDSTPTRGCSVLIVVFIAFVISFFYFGSIGPSVRPTSKSKTSTKSVAKPKDKVGMGPLTDAGFNIRSVAREVITKSLKSPSTADFPGDFEIDVAWQSPYLYQVSGYVDAENSFGANIREHWKMILLAYEKEDDHWSYQLRYAQLGNSVLVDKRSAPLPVHLSPLPVKEPAPSRILEQDDQELDVKASSEFIDAVARVLPRRNKFGLTSTMFRSIENPDGSGGFVFVPEFRVKGTEYTRKVIWFVLDGKVYCLNGATKGSVTPNRPYPREDPDADWASTGHDMHGITSYGLKLAFR